ncbi:MAG: hypothetical protein IT216_14090 [Saprospiraceae bacterium]|nr:hypothetical protein [Saprospiraceae bacterium]
MLPLLCYDVRSQLVFHEPGKNLSLDSIKTIAGAALDVVDSTSARRLATSRADIFEVKNVPYLLLDGTFDVYKWTGRKWENQYLGIYYGYNFGSTKFVHKDKIYSLGGYGYWRSHGQLIEFLPEDGEWEIIPNTTDLPRSFGVFRGDSLTMLSQDSAYVMNLKTREIISRKKYPLPPNIFVSKPIRTTINTENYTTYLSSGTPHYLVDKKDNSVKESFLSPFKVLFFAMTSGVTIVRGDSLICYNRKFEPYGQYWVGNELIQFEPVKVPGSHSSVDWWGYIVALALLLVISALFVLRQRNNRKSALPGHLPSEVPPLIEKLLTHSGEQLSQDELDEIFGIDESATYETRRYKRSQLINDLNNYYQKHYKQDIITRERDSRDKRIYVYGIGRKENRLG